RRFALVEKIHAPDLRGRNGPRSNRGHNDSLIATAVDILELVRKLERRLDDGLHEESGRNLSIVCWQHGTARLEVHQGNVLHPVDAGVAESLPAVRHQSARSGKLKAGRCGCPSDDRGDVVSALLRAGDDDGISYVRSSTDRHSLRSEVVEKSRNG